MKTAKRLTLKFFKDSGSLGGKSKSAQKIAAAKINILKAIAARREMFPKKNNENNT